MNRYLKVIGRLLAENRQLKEENQGMAKILLRHQKEAIEIAKKIPKVQPPNKNGNVYNKGGWSMGQILDKPWDGREHQ